MPCNYKLYPKNWKTFSISIRAGRALHRCECTGECGIEHSQVEAGRCTEVNHQDGKNMNGRIVLTVAHLCDCYPLCAEKTHVKAMCQACHLRTDIDRHRASRTRTLLHGSYKARRYQRASQHVGDGILAALGNASEKRKRSLAQTRRPSIPK